MGAPTRRVKKTRSKLGRGLSALVDQPAARPIEISAHDEPVHNTNKIDQIPLSVSTHSPEMVGGAVIEVDVEQVVPNPYQPRRAFSEESLEELGRSIVDHGLMQPIVVRRVSDEADGARYGLIAGERRWRASVRVGLRKIKAIVMDVAEIDSAQLALIENIQREDLNAVERARGFASLAADFGMTQEQIASRMGLGRTSVTNLLRLLDLGDEILELIASGQIGSGHGKALLSCRDVNARTGLAQRAIDEGWSVRQLERAATEYNQQDSRTDMSNSEASDGDGGAQTRVHSILSDLEKQLSEQLGTRVKLRTDKSGTRGSVTIEYYDLDHFDGLMARLGVVLDGDGVNTRVVDG
jgi:ParB family transcriptional regulator, chromosome partitioning protein